MLNMGCVDSSSSSAFQALFGPELLRSDGTAAPTVELLAVKTAVGIYFSAHWCPPCRQFTPQLAERYKALLAANKELEIVFVSSDREEASFHDYFSSMPWTALPFSARDIKAQLSSKFGVSGIPSLVFLNSDGSTITRDGRRSVMSDAYLDDFPFHPKPVIDLGNAGNARDCC